jgi:hypothetical protein
MRTVADLPSDRPKPHPLVHGLEKRNKEQIFKPFKAFVLKNSRFNTYFPYGCTPLPMEPDLSDTFRLNGGQNGLPWDETR